jgi:hypothetical protein
VLLHALLVIHKAIIVYQKAVAYTGKMLNCLGVRAVQTTKITNETLILHIRLFMKQLIKVCHDTIPFYRRSGSARLLEGTG